MPGSRIIVITPIGFDQSHNLRAIQRAADAFSLCHDTRPLGRSHLLKCWRFLAPAHDRIRHPLRLIRRQVWHRSQRVKGQCHDGIRSLGRYHQPTPASAAAVIGPSHKTTGDKDIQ